MSTDGDSPAMAALRAMLAVPPADAAGPRLAEDARLMVWMLEASRPWPDAAAAAMQALVAAHRDGVTDDATWRHLRRDAVALSDSEDVALHPFGLGDLAAGIVQRRPGRGDERDERPVRHARRRDHRLDPRR